MRECISLVNVLLLLVNDLWVARVHNALNKVRRVVYLRDNCLVFNSIGALFDLILRLHLNHLAALPNKIEADRHQLSSLTLDLKEAFKLDKPHVFDRTLNWHVNHSRHLG